MYPVNGGYKQVNLIAKPKRTEWLCDFTAKINKFYIPSFFWACYFHFRCLYRYVLASVIPGISEYWEKNKITIEIRKNHWITTRCWLIIFRIKVPFRNRWKGANVICKFQQNLRKSRITSSLRFCVTIHCSPTVCSVQIITDEQVGDGRWFVPILRTFQHFLNFRFWIHFLIHSLYIHYHPTTYVEGLFVFVSLFISPFTFLSLSLYLFYTFSLFSFFAVYLFFTFSSFSHTYRCISTHTHTYIYMY